MRRGTPPRRHLSTQSRFSAPSEARMMPALQEVIGSSGMRLAREHGRQSRRCIALHFKATSSGLGQESSVVGEIPHLS